MTQFQIFSFKTKSDQAVMILKNSGTFLVGSNIYIQFLDFLLSKLSKIQFCKSFKDALKRLTPIHYTPKYLVCLKLVKVVL